MLDDSYTLMRVFAGSWGAVFMLVSFVAVVFFTFRPGSRKLHEDTANIPFRHDDKPAARSPATKEARQ